MIDGRCRTTMTPAAAAAVRTTQNDEDVDGRYRTTFPLCRTTLCLLHSSSAVELRHFCIRFLPSIPFFTSPPLATSTGSSATFTQSTTISSTATVSSVHHRVLRHLHRHAMHCCLSAGFSVGNVAGRIIHMHDVDNRPRLYRTSMRHDPPRGAARAMLSFTSVLSRWSHPAERRASIRYTLPPTRNPPPTSSR